MEHLQGLKKKMAARDRRHAGKGNKSATGQRIACPAIAPPRRPAKVKAQPGPVGEPFSRRPAVGPSEPRKPALNRHTKEPHLHLREIARRTGQPTAHLKADAIKRAAAAARKRKLGL